LIPLEIYKNHKRYVAEILGEHTIFGIATIILQHPAARFVYKRKLESTFLTHKILIVSGYDNTTGRLPRLINI